MEKIVEVPKEVIEEVIIERPLYRENIVRQNVDKSTD